MEVAQLMNYISTKILRRKNQPHSNSKNPLSDRYRHCLALYMY